MYSKLLQIYLEKERGEERGGERKTREDII